MITSKAKPFRILDAVPEPYEHHGQLAAATDDVPLLVRAKELVDGIAGRLGALHKEVEATEAELENARKLLTDITVMSRKVGGDE